MPLLTVRRATERKLESADLLLIPYFVAFLKGDDEELRRTATAARKTPRFGGHHLASGGARPGSLRPPAGRETDVRGPRRDRAAVGSARTGRPCSKRPEPCGKRFTGMRPPPGRAPARRSRWDRGRDVDYAAAFALALSGDLPQSRALAEDLAREFPEDTFVQFMYLPTLRALFALNARDPAAAIQALQIASRYDLAYGGVGFIGRFGGLVPDLRSRTGVPRGAVSRQRPPPSSSGSSIIAASCSSIRWTRWRACSWRERSRSLATRQRRRAPTAIS